MYDDSYFLFSRRSLLLMLPPIECDLGYRFRTRVTTKLTGTQGQQGHNGPRQNPYPDPKLNHNPYA